MTEALYLNEQTATEFTATVDRVSRNRVVLNRTLFYPTGGGQPHDTGCLSVNGDTWTVTDVTKKDRIYHTLDTTPPPEGTIVHGELDWARRYAHMRYHTAQHVLSAILLDEFDARTTGNQLYTNRARIDCAYHRFTENDLHRIEETTNAVITRNDPIRTYSVPREEAEETLDPERTRLELLPSSITEIRIVEIGTLDRTACAGTHVSSTAEIGTVRITGRETKGSDEERINFELE